MPSSWKLVFITHNSLVNVSKKRIRLVYVLVVLRDSGNLPRQFPRVMSEKNSKVLSQKVSLHASASVGTGELIRATWQNIQCWRGTCEKMVSREREKVIA